MKFPSNARPPSRLLIGALTFGALAFILPLIPWTHAGPPPAAAAAGPVVPATVKGSVHSIEIPTSQHEMPAGPNLEVYNANCVVCHSNRYVTMQPKFTRKTWESEVTKMANVYGAPIGVEPQKQIVDYLMAIRGKEDAPAAPKTAGGDSAATKK